MFTNGNCSKLKKTEIRFYWVTRRHPLPSSYVLVAFRSWGAYWPFVVLAGANKGGSIEDQHLSRAKLGFHCNMCQVADSKRNEGNPSTKDWISELYCDL